MEIVRPLRWDNEADGWWTAESPVGLCYEVRVSGSGRTRVRMANGNWQYFEGSPIQARAACQFDFAARVEECLDYATAEPV